MACPICSGEGVLRDARLAWDEPDAPYPDCPHCNATGHLRQSARLLREELQALGYGLKRAPGGWRTYPDNTAGTSGTHATLADVARYLAAVKRNRAAQS